MLLKANQALATATVGKVLNFFGLSFGLESKVLYIKIVIKV